MCLAKVQLSFGRMYPSSCSGFQKTHVFLTLCIPCKTRRLTRMNLLFSSFVSAVGEPRWGRFCGWFRWFCWVWCCSCCFQPWASCWWRTGVTARPCTTASSHSPRLASEIMLQVWHNLSWDKSHSTEENSFQSQETGSAKDRCVVSFRSSEKVTIVKTDIEYCFW